MTCQRPALPPLVLLGLLVAAAPAVLTPPPRVSRTVPRVREREEVAA